MINIDNTRDNFQLISLLYTERIDILDDVVVFVKELDRHSW